MTKEFPMTNAEFSLITRASSGESRGLPSRRQRSFHRLATLCWERIGHWGYWSFTGHCGIGHWLFAPNANPLEMSRNQFLQFEGDRFGRSIAMLLQVETVATQP